MHAVVTKLREEFRAVLPPTIFFFVMLHLVAIIRMLMLEGTGLRASTPLQVTIAALILGKAVLIADHLPIINLYPHKPLIYNVVWKTVIYMLVATLIHYLERVVDFWGEAGNLMAANQQAWSHIVWPRFLALEMILLILIFGYNTVHELVRVIGRDEALRMFFGVARREA